MRIPFWSICLILQCSFWQCGAALAQANGPPPDDRAAWQQLESQVREARERRLRLQEELERLQSRSGQPVPTGDEVNASKRASTRDPSQTLALEAKGYDLLSALSDTELLAVKRKDMLRLAGRGQDNIPQTSPLLARVAESAKITVEQWFARLPPSEVVGSNGAGQPEPGPMLTGSIQEAQRPSRASPQGSIASTPPLNTTIPNAPR